MREHSPQAGSDSSAGEPRELFPASSGSECVLAVSADGGCGDEELVGEDVAEESAGVAWGVDVGTRTFSAPIASLGLPSLGLAPQ